MTPKEKAKEIFDKMKGFRVKHSHSKKCALVCVDEIIKILHLMDGGFSFEKEIDYWQEVKKEIEKINQLKQ